jgi:hypothetical protein
MTMTQACQKPFSPQNTMCFASMGFRWNGVGLSLPEAIHPECDLPTHR